MPTQWSEAEQVPLGCIAPPFSHHIPGGADPSAPTLRLPSVRPVFSLSFRGREAPVGIRSLFMSTSGQRPPPTFAASRQRRDLIIANPRVGVSKGEGTHRPKAIGKEDSVKETHQGFLSRSIPARRRRSAQQTAFAAIKKDTQKGVVP